MDVRLPDGRVITNVPDGTTRSELMRRVQSETGPQVGPPTGTFREFTDQPQGTPRQRMGFQLPHPIGPSREFVEFAKRHLPLAVASATAPLSGSVILSSLLGGAGAGITKAIQEFNKENISPQDALQSGFKTGSETAGEFLVGGGIAKALTPLARTIFGRSATEEGTRAVQFAREEGTFLPLDSVTDGQLLQGVRILLAGNRSSNQKAGDAARFIVGKINSFTGRAPDSETIAQATQKFLTKKPITGLDRFAQQGDKTSTVWFRELFTPSNAGGLNKLRKVAPEIHQDLLARNLANVFDQFTSKSSKFGETLDGFAFRKWFENNERTVLKIYGPAITQKLDNFSNYTRFLDKSIAKAEEGIQATPLVLRLGAEGSAAFGIPEISAVVQGASWVLGHTLMNPSSAAFKFFAALPGAGKAARTALQAGTAETGAGEFTLEKLKQKFSPGPQ